MIASLLHSFPKDHKTEAGNLFWSGPKRCPEPVAFNPEDSLHVDFIFHTANLFAHIFNLKPMEDKNIVAKLAQQVEIK